MPLRSQSSTWLLIKPIVLQKMCIGLQLEYDRQVLCHTGCHTKLGVNVLQSMGNKRNLTCGKNIGGREFLRDILGFYK